REEITRGKTRKRKSGSVTSKPIPAIFASRRIGASLPSSRRTSHTRKVPTKNNATKVRIKKGSAMNERQYSTVEETQRSKIDLPGQAKAREAGLSFLGA